MCIRDRAGTFHVWAIYKDIESNKIPITVQRSKITAHGKTIDESKEKDGYETTTVEVTTNSQIHVTGKEGQRIDLEQFDEKAAFTYGENASYNFQAFVAAKDAEDAKDIKKHWTINTNKNNDEYDPQINFHSVEQDKENSDLWVVKGTISFKAVYARDVEITVAYSQDATEKVYKDAETFGIYSIKKKELTVSGIAFDEKIYDGTPNANVRVITLDGILNQDDVQAVTTAVSYTHLDVYKRQSWD